MTRFADETQPRSQKDTQPVVDLAIVSTFTKGHTAGIGSGDCIDVRERAHNRWSSWRLYRRSPFSFAFTFRLTFRHPWVFDWGRKSAWAGGRNAACRHLMRHSAWRKVGHAALCWLSGDHLCLWLLVVVPLSLDRALPWACAKFGSRCCEQPTRGIV